MSCSILLKYKTEVEATTATTEIEGSCNDEEADGPDEREDGSGYGCSWRRT